MDPVITTIIFEIELPNFHPFACLRPPNLSTLLLNEGERCYALTLKGGVRGLLRQSFVELGGGYAMERLYQGALDFSWLWSANQGFFTPHGLTLERRDWFRANLETVYGLWQERQREEQHFDIEKRFLLAAEKEARLRVSHVRGLAQGAGVADLLGGLVSDCNTRDGLRNTVGEIHAKLENEHFRKPLLLIGMTEAQVKRFGDLREILHKDRDERSREAAFLDGALRPIRIAKGGIYGDMTIGSQLARTEMDETQAAPFLLTDLLDVPRRATRLEDPAAGQGQTPPTPAPGQIGAGQTQTPVAGGQSPGAISPPEVRPPVIVTPAAGSAGTGAAGTQPGTGTAGTHTGAASGTPAGTGTAGTQPGTGAAAGIQTGTGATPTGAAGTAGTGVPWNVHLAPGTVIFRKEVQGGPALQAVVQNDGSWAWLMEEAPAAGTRPGSAPPAPSPAKPKKGRGAAPRSTRR